MYNRNEQDQEELKHLTEQEHWIHEEIKKIKETAVAALKEDLQAFPEREIKRRFLEHASFAESLNREQIRAIKQDIKAGVQGVVEQVISCLMDLNLWINAQDSDMQGPGKSLMENHGLRQCVKPIEDMVKEIMHAHDFPEDSFASLGYKMPTWFIHRTFLPAIAEKYWKLQKDLKDIKKRKDALQDKIKRSDLADKWDSV